MKIALAATHHAGSRADALDAVAPVLRAVLRLTQGQGHRRPGIDYAMLHKIYGSPAGTDDERRYSPAVCTGVDIRVVEGDPDPGNISTAYVERQNLTMRMGMRRFTRLTNGFSKKVENRAVSLHYVNYDFARPHKTLARRNRGYPTTPAMAAGVTDHAWTLREIAGLLD